MTVDVDALLAQPTTHMARLLSGIETLGHLDSVSTARLEEGIAAALSAGERWPATLLDLSASALARPDCKTLHDALDRALVLDWLARDLDANLKPFAEKAKASKDDRLPTATHLNQYERSRQAVRFLWRATASRPDIEHAKPRREQFYGWVATAALERVALPGGYRWTDIVGQDRARWTVLINKNTSSLAGQMTHVSTHDFAIYLSDEELTIDDAERVRSEIAALRGIRAVVLSMRSRDGHPAALLQRALLSSLRKNVGVFLSRSVQGDAFFGRREEIDQVNAALADGRAVAITGARKIGKSSLAAQYTRHFGGAVGVLDLQKEGDPFDRATLLSCVRNRVATGKGASFDELLGAVSSLSEPPFLVIDEFGVIFERAKSNAHAAEGVLALTAFLRRAVEDRKLRLLVCNPLCDLYRQTHVETPGGPVDNPLLGVFDVITLRGLERGASGSLLEFYSRRSLCRFQSSAAEYAVSVSGGFPWLLRSILHAATRDKDRPLIVDEEMVRAVVAYDSAANSPWQIADSLWQWGTKWSGDHLRLAAQGLPAPDDDIAEDLKRFGLLSKAGNDLAVPLLRDVALRTMARSRSK